MNREDAIIVFLAFWSLLAVLFISEGIYYACRWLRQRIHWLIDRIRWIRWFSWH